MAVGDETTIMLRDCDMEVMVREEGSGITLNFISQDGSRFSVCMTGADFGRFADFLASGIGDNDDEEDGQDGDSPE